MYILQEINMPILTSSPLHDGSGMALNHIFCIDRENRSVTIPNYLIKAYRVDENPSLSASIENGLVKDGRVHERLRLSLIHI